jgi:hypothetical protein
MCYYDCHHWLCPCYDCGSFRDSHPEHDVKEHEGYWYHVLSLDGIDLWEDHTSTFACELELSGVYNEHCFTGWSGVLSKPKLLDDLCAECEHNGHQIHNP